MKGFVVRFENEKDFLDIFTMLKNEGYMTDLITIGTDLSNTISNNDIIFKEKYISNHYIDTLYGNGVKVSDKQYITLSINNRINKEQYITGISIGLPTNEMKQKYTHLIGKKGITMSLQTILDDKCGDVYNELIEPKNVLKEISRLVGENTNN